MTSETPEIVNPIIVAMDGKSIETSKEIMRVLGGKVWGFKFNDLFLDSKAASLAEFSGNFFIDLKLHDIPNTVYNQVRRLGDHPLVKDRDVFLTVHASGGTAMMKEAVGATKMTNIKILAVSVLTSLDKRDCNDIYGADPAHKVSQLAEMAAKAGVHGMVCSAAEVESVKYKHPQLKYVVPAVRPDWFLREKGDHKDDQKRVATVTAARDRGASFLVIGRPILGHSDPAKAAELTLAEWGS